MPYAKVNGLGKLSHVSALRYNAKPWVREVTLHGVIPQPEELQLITPYGYRTVISAEYTTTALGLEGETVIPVDAAFVAEASAGDLVQLGGALWYTIESVDTTNNEITLNRGLVQQLDIGEKVKLESKELYGYVGQQRAIRVRLLDGSGAPAGQRPITAQSYDSSVARILADTLNTNQDGEWMCLVEFLSTGSTNIKFTGSGSVTLPVTSVALPAGDSIGGTPAGPAGCDTVEYPESETTWSV